MPTPTSGKKENSLMGWFMAVVLLALITLLFTVRFIFTQGLNTEGGLEYVSGELTNFVNSQSSNSSNNNSSGGGVGDVIGSVVGAIASIF